MASRLGRQAFSTTARAARSRTRSNVHVPRRFMSADAGAHHEFKPKPDLPWIVTFVIVVHCTVSYLTLHDELNLGRCHNFSSSCIYCRSRDLRLRTDLDALEQEEEKSGKEGKKESGKDEKKEDAAKDEKKGAKDEKKEDAKGGEEGKDATKQREKEESKGGKLESTPSKEFSDGKEQQEKKGDKKGEKEESK
ncbi:hypothetical protein B0H16DRAFT_1514521 [Mycena metata]|uniref:Uncharacterized protein n=1 Tax=Mycena metata TaxID=1033252 RepID=A0AAD7JTU7_9AGAR|nr:hypothetical protein B0H16DRAFT_1514521 [Mycena metata]